jgi:hypothetical protein
MTKDEVTALAREAGFVGMDGDHGALRRFAALVAAHEREACAKVADEWTYAYPHPSKVIAETIRKRG